MSINRRRGARQAWRPSRPAALLGRRAGRAAITPGKPFAGKEIKVLAVQSTQFAAHAKKVAAFAEQTGIKVTYVYVPFVALRERLTAEMVGGSDDFDIVTAMDVWIPPLVDKYLAPIDKDVAARKIDLKRYPGAVPGVRPSSRRASTACRSAATSSSCGTARTCSTRPGSSRPRPGTRWSRPARRSRSRTPASPASRSPTARPTART